MIQAHLVDDGKVFQFGLGGWDKELKHNGKEIEFPGPTAVKIKALSCGGK